MSLDHGQDLGSPAFADPETGRRPPAAESLVERRPWRESERRWSRARMVGEVLIVGGLIGFAWFERGTIERSVTYHGAGRHATPRRHLNRTDEARRQRGRPSWFMTCPLQSRTMTFPLA
jgi:hypothetical protein